MEGVAIPQEPFDARQVIDICDAMRNQPGFEKRRNVVENWYAILHREEGVNISGISQKLEYRSPSPAVNLDRFRNRMVAATFRLKVSPRKTDDKAVRRAQTAENFGYFLYFDLTRKRTAAVFAPDDRAYDQQVWAGVGIRHFDWNKDIRHQLLDADAEDIKKAAKKIGPALQGNPFSLSAPDILAVFYDLDFTNVCEVAEHTISSLIATYDGLDFVPEHGFEMLASDAIPTDLSQENWNKTVLVYHLETQKYIYEVVDNTKFGGGAPLLLDMWENAAGRPRYTFAAGHLTSAREPERMFRPLLHPLYPTTQLRNIMGTLLMSGALNTGRPLLQEVKTGSGADDAWSILSRPSEERRNITVDLGTGTLPVPRQGYEWRPLGLPTPEQLIIAYQQLVAEDREYGFPASLSPGDPVEATSGFDRTTQQQGAADFLDPPLSNTAAAWHDGLMLAFEQIRYLGLPVQFIAELRAQGQRSKGRQAQTIQPEDLEDIDMQVTFRSTPAGQEFAEREMMRRDVTEGYTAQSTYMAVLHDDPVAERERVTLDRMEQLADAKAMEDAVKMLDALRGDATLQVANEMGIPLPPAQNGGRPERPPSPFPGVGSPVTPPNQSQGGVPTAPPGSTGVG